MSERCSSLFLPSSLFKNSFRHQTLYFVHLYTPYMCVLRHFKVAATSLKLEIRLHAHPVANNHDRTIWYRSHFYPHPNWPMCSELGYVFFFFSTSYCTLKTWRPLGRGQDAECKFSKSAFIQQPLRIFLKDSVHCLYHS